MTVHIIEIYRPAKGEKRPIPLFIEGVQAGFPSPADDYIEKQLDINDLVIEHPTATFFVRVEGDSMRDAGILSGDILVVDRSLEPSHNKIVIAVVDGEFTVKRIHMQSGCVRLIPENPSYPAIDVSAETDFKVWGIVTYVIHKTR